MTEKTMREPCPTGVQGARTLREPTCVWRGGGSSVVSGAKQFFGGSDLPSSYLLVFCCVSHRLYMHVLHSVRASSVPSAERVNFTNCHPVPRRSHQVRMVHEGKCPRNWRRSRTQQQVQRGTQVLHHTHHTRRAPRVFGQPKNQRNGGRRPHVWHR